MKKQKWNCEFTNKQKKYFQKKWDAENQKEKAQCNIFIPKRKRFLSYYFYIFTTITFDLRWLNDEFSSTKLKLVT